MLGKPQERLTRGTVICTMRRAAHPSGCARYSDGCSAIEFQSCLQIERGLQQEVGPNLNQHQRFSSLGRSIHRYGMWRPLSSYFNQHQRFSSLGRPIHRYGMWRPLSSSVLPNLGSSLLDFNKVLQYRSSIHIRLNALNGEPHLPRIELDHLTEMCSGSEAGAYLRLIDSRITQLEAQGPFRT